MNHNHIYSDSVSCEQLKAVDIISKEEGHVCPTNPLTKKNNNKQTNEKYTNMGQPCGTSNRTYWNIWESSILLIECLWVSSLLVCQLTLCLDLPQCSELTCCCLIILCYAKLFIKKNLLLTMYYKENFMRNSIIITTDGLQ